MAKKPIVAQLMPIVARSKKNMEILVKESIQRTVDIAQFPVAKGGKMPIDTGFLRASGQLRLNGMPQGPTRPGAAPAAPTGPLKRSRIKAFGDADVSAGLVGFTLGLSIFFGWTAIYARRINMKYGFLDNAVAAWPKTVRDVTKDVLRRSLK